MGLALILPPVHPEVCPDITGCPYAGCGGRHLQHWQTVPNRRLHDLQRRNGELVTLAAD